MMNFQPVWAQRQPLVPLVFYAGAETVSPSGAIRALVGAFSQPVGECTGPKSALNEICD
jgi:hypothetical protein